MNLVDIYVEKVLKVYFDDKMYSKKWCVDCECNSWGRKFNHTLQFDTESEALQIKENYCFLG